jgi:hypothetical protein
VFPHCEPASLLALRAVCRAWLAQLNVAPARLWLPLTMTVSRMSYAERLRGWPGVPAAMRREEITRTNCDAGHFTRGPALDVDEVKDLRLAAGHIAVFCPGSVHLFAADTGARLASFGVERAGCRVHVHAVCDRWIPFTARDGRVLLLDCAAARLVQIAAAAAEARNRLGTFSVAGPYVSFRRNHNADIMVAHVSGGSDGATVVCEVAHVALSDRVDQFALCERGRSYVLFEGQQHALRLMEVATGQCKRVFTPRACLITSALMYCTDPLCTSQVIFSSAALSSFTKAAISWPSLRTM